MGFKNIEMKDRILIGQTMVKGHGVGTDNVTGDGLRQMRSTALSMRLISAGTHDVDAFVIVAGLGRGTVQEDPRCLHVTSKGSTGNRCMHLGIIPAPEEGRLYSYNAARSLQPW